MSDQPEQSKLTHDYNVVFVNKQGEVTWTNFSGKEELDAWYGGTMKDGTDKPLSEVYKIVAEGVTPHQASQMVRVSLGLPPEGMVAALI